jgi:hypothetical protein
MIVCNKLVRRDFLENNSCIFFNSALARFEDSELALKWWLNAPKVSLVNEYTYFYRQQVDDLPCRSNRKPGGLDAAPSHRLALAREVLEYRHLVNQDDEVVVLPILLHMLVTNLFWDSVAPKSNRLNEGLNYALEAARHLDSSLLNRLEIEPRNVLMLLKRGRGTEALKALSLNWNAIRGEKKFQVGSI